LVNRTLSGRNWVNELKSSGKPFDISKWEVWEAYRKVKANKGAPGVDGCSIEDFESDLKNNLYRVWNRMSSGSYRPGRSALDAVAACRKRCWRKDWVIDLDVQKFFDSVPWDLVIKSVEVNADQPWVVLYVRRWLAAPLQLPDGTLAERDRGTPQGSLCSAEHNPPYEQRWVMRSVGRYGLMTAISGVDHCA
jgi:retron-type reverse transcriptase